MLAPLLGLLMVGKGLGTYIAMALTIIGQVVSWAGAPHLGDPLRDVGLGLGGFTLARAGVAGPGKPSGLKDYLVRRKS